MKEVLIEFYMSERRRLLDRILARDWEDDPKDLHREIDRIDAVLSVILQKIEG